MGRHVYKQDAVLPRPTIKVGVIAAAKEEAYHLCHMIANGRMFGNYQNVEISLIVVQEGEYEGLVMELEDSAYRTLDKVTCTD